MGYIIYRMGLLCRMGMREGIVMVRGTDDGSGVSARVQDSGTRERDRNADTRNERMPSFFEWMNAAWKEEWNVG